MSSEASEGSVAEVFTAFLKLGLTSFGGPIAHLGYFRNEFVERRKWLDETSYADLVALCQFLPGPASSEVGNRPTNNAERSRERREKRDMKSSIWLAACAAVDGGGRARRSACAWAGPTL